MNMRIVHFLVLLFLTSGGFSGVTSAQNASPGVELVCESSSVRLDVEPGADRSGSVSCTVSNPSVHYEEISLFYQWGGGAFVVSGPGSESLGPGAESEFVVEIQGELMAWAGQAQLRITAYVDMVNGVPPPSSYDSQYNIMVTINQFGSMRVESGGDVDVYSGDECWASFIVLNEGNGYDFAYLNLEGMDDLVDAGWMVEAPWSKIQVDPFSPFIVNVYLTAPDNLDIMNDISEENFAIDRQEVTGNGTIKNTYSLEMTVMSEFNYRTLEQQGESIPATSSLIVTEYPVEEEPSVVSDILPSLSVTLCVLAIVSAAAFNRRHDNEFLSQRRTTDR